MTLLSRATILIVAICGLWAFETAVGAPADVPTTLLSNQDKDDSNQEMDAAKGDSPAALVNNALDQEKVSMESSQTPTFKTSKVYYKIFITRCNRYYKTAPQWMEFPKSPSGV